jgi:hypothetical protein
MKDVIKTMKRKLYMIVNLHLSTRHKRQNCKKSPLTWLFQQKNYFLKKTSFPQQTNKQEFRVGLKLHFKNQQITKRKPIQNE